MPTLCKIFVFFFLKWRIITKTQLTRKAGVALALAFIFSCSSNEDNKDDNNYCEQIWMAENLNYYVPLSKCGAETGSYVTDFNTSNCDVYGRLYDWTTAQTVCPFGWRIPSEEDWNELFLYIDDDNKPPYYPERGEGASKHLKAVSGWDETNVWDGGTSYFVRSNGTDTFGFAALPGGSNIGTGLIGSNCYSGDYFSYKGIESSWWSTTNNVTSPTAQSAHIRNNSSVYAQISSICKVWRLSVRCIKND
jgi:uncharacterized protein (TIGR02145 family)